MSFPFAKAANLAKLLRSVCELILIAKFKALPVSDKISPLFSKVLSLVWFGLKIILIK